MYAQIMSTIILPTVTRMLEEGRKYKGALYAGLMLTEEGPKVLEYNCRFGDPETQPQMIRLESDFVEILMAAIPRTSWPTKWPGAAGRRVASSSPQAGIPGPYKKGKIIKGLEAAARTGADCLSRRNEIRERPLPTNGGRVLGVCASEPRLPETMTRIYRAVDRISFEGMHYRRDIGVVEAEEVSIRPGPEKEEIPWMS